MGKKQHSKDRLFITQSEWKKEFGGKKDHEVYEKQILPFNCCCLSFQPVVDGVMTKEGFLFEKKNIYKYLKEYHVNPCTGKKMTIKDLFPVHFYKNSDNEYHCPVTYKVFTLNSKIAVIRTSGNVYLYDCIKELNIDQNCWEDLISGDPFTKDDIIILQDPSKPDHRQVSDFFHIKQEDHLKKKKKKDTSVALNPSMQRLIDEIRSKSEKEKKEELQKKWEFEAARPRSLQTSNAYSSSLTSSAITMENKYDFATDEEIERRRYDLVRNLKKKGYVQLVTSLGTLNLEIHCDLVPRTSENFLGLCTAGKYDNTPFHRLIPHFMVQGGDPTGTGTGGESLWKRPFADEFHPSLTHSARGVVSMANSGPNTNGSQFFITFEAAPHLDRVHSVFGRVVGGLAVLQAIEEMHTDAKDRPTKPLTLVKAIVLSNPFDLADQIMKRDLEIEKSREKAVCSRRMCVEQQAEKTQPKPQQHGGLGKLLNLADEEEEDEEEKKRKSILESIEQQTSKHEERAVTASRKPKNGGFGDFSSWYRCLF